MLLLHWMEYPYVKKKILNSGKTRLLLGKWFISSVVVITWCGSWKLNKVNSLVHRRKWRSGFLTSENVKLNIEITWKIGRCVDLDRSILIMYDSSQTIWSHVLLPSSNDCILLVHAVLLQEDGTISEYTQTYIGGFFLKVQLQTQSSIHRCFQFLHWIENEDEIKQDWFANQKEVQLFWYWSTNSKRNKIVEIV